MILISGLLETFGVASIMPFMAVLSNPTLIESNSILKNLFNFKKVLGINSNQEFLFVLGVIIFFLFVLSIIIKALTLYLQLNFTLMCEHSIGKRLIEGYLKQPYVWFLNRNSADLGKTVLSEVNNVIENGAMPIMTFFTQIVVLLLLVLFLIYINPTVTFMIFLTLGSIYVLIYKFSRNYLKKIGSEKLKSNEDRILVMNAAFGSPKELKVNHLEKFFLNIFSKPSKNYARLQASAQIINVLPRYFLEIFAFGGMLLLVLYLIFKDSNFMNSVPIIALFAFAGYRILPALQQVYGALTRMRFITSSLDALYEDYKFLNYRQTKN